MKPFFHSRHRLLALFLIFALVLPSLVITAGAAEAGLQKLLDVTGLYGIDGLRESMFGDSVIKNQKKADDDYWIFVHFKGASVSEQYETTDKHLSLQDYAKTQDAADRDAALREEQALFLKQLDEKGIAYECKYAYTLLSNAIAIRVKYKDVKAVRAISGVKSVTFSEHYDEPLAISNDANVWSTGIYKTEGIKYTGAGMVVAVLDTGLDASHDAFAIMPETQTLTKDMVSSLVFNGTAGGLNDLDDGSTTVDDVYYNAKVPFAYDYADKDPIVYPSYSTHGTHVAGIIAGNLGEEKEKEPIKDIDGNPILNMNGDTMTFRGVAPDAQLVICKVFTDREDSKSLGGADTIDILAALEDCVKLGVDAINMSLGSSCGFSEGNDEHMVNVYNSIKEAGISLVVAASNDYSSAYGSTAGTNLTSNPDSATVGSPSTYDAALSVASISGQLSRYLLVNKGSAKEAFAFFREASDSSGHSKKFVEEMLATNAGIRNEDGSVTFEYVPISLYGQTAGYTGKNVEGKIALIQRGGDVTFEDKVRTAKQNGAIGAIIYNNVSGNIGMSLGSSKTIPACSITMDASAALLNNLNPSTGTGTVTISMTQAGGPFMSDFSSWGPNPSLELKPEITAHGGDITSAVPGGWDQYSGTSMASPNMAGAFLLVLQYIREKFPDITDRQEQVSFANQLIMSTATIAYNEFETPYSPRKQGAGLATIANAIESNAYLYVKAADGSVKAKTKLELGDDPQKTGTYVLDFYIRNYDTVAKTYNLETLTMTETVSSDGKTVAEHAYMLDSLSAISYTVNGQTVNAITVAPNQDAHVVVTIQLNDAAKQYLDSNFKNGMYVEGFVRLNPAGEEHNSLSLPWLAFYGDWYAAPMFDYSTYDIADFEQDDSIPDDEKPFASVYATVPLGMYYDEKYIMPLGTYLYSMPSGTSKKIYPSKDKIAISTYDEDNHHTINKLYSIYAGLLRGAKTMQVNIKDAVTGELLYEKTELNVRKAYSGGSTTARASFIQLELDPVELGLSANRQYIFEMYGVMETAVGKDAPEQKATDSFTFPFVVDNEAPEILDYRVRYDAYKDGKETKYKVYLDVDVYDNQYAMSVALCYANTDDMSLRLLSGEVMPVEGTKGSTTTVTMDITDYYDKGIDLYLQVEDYAMNARSYMMDNFKPLMDAVKYPESIEIQEGDITMDINEVKKLNLTVSPSDAAVTDLPWTSSNENVVKVQNGELFAVGSGTAIVTVYGSSVASGKVKAQIRVTVTDKVSGTAVRLKGLTLNLFEAKSGGLKDPTGSIEVHPNSTYYMQIGPDPWYYDLEKLNIRFESSAPEIAEVTENGIIHTLREGTVFITARQYDENGVASAFSVSAILQVGPEFVVSNGYLRGYYGQGGKVTIPNTLGVYYIDENAFLNNDNVTELEITAPCQQISKGAFEGMTALKRVIIPDSVSFVATGAFRNCTALEQVDLRSRAITLSTYCFEGCTSLTGVNNIRLTDKSLDAEDCVFLELTDSQYVREAAHFATLGSYAFHGCTALKKIDLTQLRVNGINVFEGCSNLEEIIVSGATALGDYIFMNCENLTTITFTDTDRFDFSGYTAPFVGCHLTTFNFPNGQEGANTGSAFYYDSETDAYYTDAGKTELVFAMQDPTRTSFTLPETVKKIAAGAFAGNIFLRKVNLGNGALESIGANAFMYTGLQSVTVPATVQEMGTGVFEKCGNLTNADVQATITVLPARTFANTALSKVNLPDTVTELGDYAFSKTGFSELDLSGTGITALGDYVFSNMQYLTRISLPALKKVGFGTFYYSAWVENKPLQRVTFANGTTTIGTGTFANASNLAEVNTSAPLTEIGKMTFSGCVNLKTLNLGVLTKVDDYAFADCSALNAEVSFAESMKAVGNSAFRNCKKIRMADVSYVEKIGDNAFEGAELINALNLAGCTAIGEKAFFNSGISSVSMPKIVTIGAQAFANTKLTGEIVLPESLLNVKEEIERVREQLKKEFAQNNQDVTEKGYRVFGIAGIGVGAFANTAITSFRMLAENDTYYVQDGVLFATLANGKAELVAYPAAKEGAEYIIPDGVVRVAESAFTGVSNLKTVTFPQSIAGIGVGAFYNSSVENYIFTGLRAPVLESRQPDAAALETVLTTIFNRSSNNGKSEEKYYSNFNDYVAKLIYPEISGKDSFGLSISYPANANGFDNRLWSLYFGESVTKTDVIPDENTTAALEAIEKLPGADAINALTAQNAETWNSYKNLVQTARKAYNEVTSTEQRKLFLKEGTAQLLANEAAMRSKSAMFGETVTIQTLKVETSPAKLDYVEGELFDPTGLVLTVIYSDLSELSVAVADSGNDFTFPTEPLKAGQQNTVVYYKGVAREISIKVGYSGNGPVDPNKPSGDDHPTEEETKGLPVGAIIAIVAVAVILVAGIAVAVILILKKKKNGAPEPDGNGKSDAPAAETFAEVAEPAEPENNGEGAVSEGTDETEKTETAESECVEPAASEPEVPTEETAGSDVTDQVGESAVAEDEENDGDEKSE